MKTKTFDFEPASFVPFRDKEAVRRVRAIKREDIARHPNPDYRIEVVKDADFEEKWIDDIVSRIRQSAGGQLLMIMPNPRPSTGSPCTPSASEGASSRGSA